MAKTKNKRWSCPEGAHAGVLAPSRLRKVDIRRYCLPCSTKAGVLVERSCVANVQAAERSRQRSVKKAASKRRVAGARVAARKDAQAARETVAGVDVAREYDRVWAHATRLNPQLRPTAPPLTVSLGTDWGTSGRAWSRRGWTGRTHLTPGTGCDRVRLCGVIAHEIAHHMAYAEHHSDVFWSTLAELVQEAYPGSQVGVLDGNHWTKQAAIQAAMIAGCDFLSGGTETEPFTPPRKPPVKGQRKTKVRSVRQ